MAHTPAADVPTEEVRLYVFREAADTGRVPQPAQIVQALGRTADEIHAALTQLAAGRVLILAPNNSNIWAANPFCAVPSAFRVEARGKTYWGICIWDALGIPAALRSDAVIRASCGDCGEALTLQVRQDDLVRSEGILHFAVPAARWWENIGYT
jgi:hypothetical protein